MFYFPYIAGRLLLERKAGLYPCNRDFCQNLRMTFPAVFIKQHSAPFDADRRIKHHLFPQEGREIPHKTFTAAYQSAHYPLPRRSIVIKIHHPRNLHGLPKFTR